VPRNVCPKPPGDGARKPSQLYSGMRANRLPKITCSLIAIARPKTNAGVHLERRLDWHFVSEVVEIHAYDLGRHEYNHGFIFDSPKELV
jgi:hypothetical protein